MVRRSTALWLLLATCAGITLFLVKHEVQEREDRLNGSGLFFLNPPWRLKETLEGEVLPYLVRKLGVQKARFVVDGGGE